MKVKKGIKKWYRQMLRLRLNYKNRMRLTNHNFSIISMNCLGGVISHELGERFNSPTVNLWFASNDFVRFCKKLKYYLYECELIECKEKMEHHQYPVGILEDITIYFPYAASFKEAKQKWDERKRRVNFDNLFFLMVQRDGCTKDVIKEFDSLNYENKVIFTAKEYPEFKSAVHLVGSKETDTTISDLTRYMGRFTGKRWIDNFDYVSFLNKSI